jgi:hypothetical protein
MNYLTLIYLKFILGFYLTHASFKAWYELMTDAPPGWNKLGWLSASEVIKIKIHQSLGHYQNLDSLVESEQEAITEYRKIIKMFTHPRNK